MLIWRSSHERFRPWDLHVDWKEPENQIWRGETARDVDSITKQKMKWKLFENWNGASSFIGDSPPVNESIGWTKVDHFSVNWLFLRELNLIIYCQTNHPVLFSFVFWLRTLYKECLAVQSEWFDTEKHNSPNSQHLSLHWINKTNLYLKTE